MVALHAFKSFQEIFNIQQALLHSIEIKSKSLINLKPLPNVSIYFHDITYCGLLYFEKKTLFTFDF